MSNLFGFIWKEIIGLIFFKTWRQNLIIFIWIFKFIWRRIPSWGNLQLIEVVNISSLALNISGFRFFVEIVDPFLKESKSLEWSLISFNFPTRAAKTWIKGEYWLSSWVFFGGLWVWLCKISSNVQIDEIRLCILVYSIPVNTKKQYIIVFIQLFLNIIL
jgi:hypothetical protein